MATASEHETGLKVMDATGLPIPPKKLSNKGLAIG